MFCRRRSSTSISLADLRIAAEDRVDASRACVGTQVRVYWSSADGASAAVLLPEPARDGWAAAARRSDESASHGLKWVRNAAPDTRSIDGTLADSCAHNVVLLEQRKQQPAGLHERLLHHDGRLHQRVLQKHHQIRRKRRRACVAALELFERRARFGDQRVALEPEVGQHDREVAAFDVEQFEQQMLDFDVEMR